MGRQCLFVTAKFRQRVAAVDMGINRSDFNASNAIIAASASS